MANKIPCAKKCQNGGTCQVLDKKEMCTCLDGFIGEDCGGKKLTSVNNQYMFAFISVMVKKIHILCMPW